MKFRPVSEIKFLPSRECALNRGVLYYSIDRHPRICDCFLCHISLNANFGNSTVTMKLSVTDGKPDLQVNKNLNVPKLGSKLLHIATPIHELSWS